MKVSIIVPIYNGENKIDRCVRSIRNQSYTDIEVILIDDGSSDDSLGVCNAYCKLDPRVKVIHQENAGVSAARNTGIDNASGQWIMFVDSDDWLEPLAVEEIVETMCDTDSEVGVYSYFSEFLDNEIATVLPVTSSTGSQILFNEKLQMHMDTVICTIWNKMYKTELIINNNIRFNTNIKFGEDFIFNCSIYSKNPKICSTSSVLYHYDCSDINSASNILYLNYNEYINSMHSAFINMLDVLLINNNESRVFCEYFIAARWRYAIDKCISSSIPLQNKVDVLIKWIVSIPDNIRQHESFSINGLQFITNMDCYRESIKKQVILYIVKTKLSRIIKNKRQFISEMIHKYI